MSDPIRFVDGEGYEQFMGVWSRQAGATFLDWLTPAPAQRWLDVGCGNGAFTELVVARCAPHSIDGIDPSVEQLAYARAQPALRDAHFRQGDAMLLPYGAGAFDMAVMPLVIFFVPEPAVGVAEMVRVVRAGGVVSAYAWDMPGGGFPYASMQSEMRALGHAFRAPPSASASSVEALRTLWEGAGLQRVETQVITVQRHFDTFDDWWSTALLGPSIADTIAAMPADALAQVRARMHAVLAPDTDGRIVCTATANAVRGTVPG